MLAPYRDVLTRSAGVTGPDGPPAIAPPRGDLRSQLSRRELEIVDIAARGLTNLEIGSCLNLSEPTVKWHLQNAFRKLGVSTRTEAIFLTRQGTLTEAERFDRSQKGWAEGFGDSRFAVQSLRFNHGRSSP